MKFFVSHKDFTSEPGYNLAQPVSADVVQIRKQPRFWSAMESQPWLNTVSIKLEDQIRSSAR
jgi:hypothetical protein